MFVLTLNHAQTFQFECFLIHHKKRVHLASRKFVIIAKTGSRPFVFSVNYVILAIASQYF